ncbi:hypothetical protein XENTR_v10007032 [Xenopus tropicalis]|nr:hypothetical protein XENTR_v10007032 [Xenopus tropicalis]
MSPTSPLSIVNFHLTKIQCMSYSFLHLFWPHPLLVYYCTVFVTESSWGNSFSGLTYVEPVSKIAVLVCLVCKSLIVHSCTIVARERKAILGHELKGVITTALGIHDSLALLS